MRGTKTVRVQIRGRAYRDICIGRCSGVLLLNMVAFYWRWWLLCLVHTASRGVIRASWACIPGDIGIGWCLSEHLHIHYIGRIIVLIGYLEYVCQADWIILAQSLPMCALLLYIPLFWHSSFDSGHQSGPCP
jgi:hypothetical protein